MDYFSYPGYIWSTWLDYCWPGIFKSFCEQIFWFSSWYKNVLKFVDMNPRWLKLGLNLFSFLSIFQLSKQIKRTLQSNKTLSQSNWLANHDANRPGLDFLQTCRPIDLSDTDVMMRPDTPTPKIAPRNRPTTKRKLHQNFCKCIRIRHWTLRKNNCLFQF